MIQDDFFLQETSRQVSVVTKVLSSKTDDCKNAQAFTRECFKQEHKSTSCLQLSNQRFFSSPQSQTLIFSLIC